MYYIWYKAEGGKWEIVERTKQRREVASLWHNTRMAYALYEGQHRYGKDHLKATTDSRGKNVWEDYSI
jgi:hypothetical protein